MTEGEQAFVAYVNGHFMEGTPGVSVHDAGFVQGLTVSEQLRTFGGRLFRLEQHLERLGRSLAILGVRPGLSLEELGAVAREVAARNQGRLDPDDDLGVTMFVTPGRFNAAKELDPGGPLTCVHAQPIAFGSWAHKYTQGERLTISNVRQVSPRSWPAELKCRSRMHYHLADREARSVDPRSRALLLDLDGFVSEASTANVLAYFRGEGLVSPLRTKILPGISLDTIRSIAVEREIPFQERDLLPEELLRADEVMLCSTSPCLLPVVRINDQPVSSGRPGPVFEQVLDAWSQHVGLSIADQARRFADRWVADAVDRKPEPGFRYTVRCIIENGGTDLADAWLDWMYGEHLGQVLASGARSAEIVRLDGPVTTFEARYVFASRQEFQHYERDHAPRLRADGLRRFPPESGIRFERTTGEIV